MNTQDRLARFLQDVRDSDRREIWIHLGDPDELARQAHDIDTRVAAGDELALAGRLVAVKDNIDVTGMPTTAGCPTYNYRPDRDAEAVARLRQAGALIVGKTNMDQFATGLVGTRSPYGAVRNAWDPDRISGGSSSGSAVAVALGQVDLALGTDTAGSGRVPAALNGIVGVKPSRGTIPTHGVVPACKSLDCVTVFARDRALAQHARRIMADPPTSLRTRHDAQLRIGIPLPGQLQDLPPGWNDAFVMAVDAARAAGCQIVEVDIDDMLQAARLLYEGAFVAERYAAVGEFIDTHRDQIGDQIDSTVAGIVLNSRTATAVDLFRDMEHLEQHQHRTQALFDTIDALLTPTTTRFPTHAQIHDEPISINAAMGRFTNCANLLDLASLAIPASLVDRLPFGIMLTAPAGSDDLLDHIADTLTHRPIALLVVGAHMQHLPLNSELVTCGATFNEHVTTAAHYNLFALDTTPPKPAMVRTTTPTHAGITGELWTLPANMLATFMGRLPQPMTIGPVDLDDGRQVLGFLAEAAATHQALDITSYAGWRAWLNR